MLHAFGWHGSTLIDTIGHCFSLALFGFLIILFVREAHFDHQPQNKLSTVAAAIVFLWNLGELIVLGHGNDPVLGLTRAAALLSFCSITILPAVLLHISLQNSYKGITAAGYCLSAAAIVLQFAQSGPSSSDRSRYSLLVLSFGFALLSLGVWLWSEHYANRRKWLGEPNRVAFLSLVIFASSFLHLQPGHVSQMWIGEAIWHHAAIPIALIVLLHNYRFLLVDVFLRFAVSATAVALWFWAIAIVNAKFHLLAAASRSDYVLGLLLAALGVLTFLLTRALQQLQVLMTRVAFRRRPLDNLLQTLQTGTGTTEQDLLDQASRHVAQYFASKRSSVIASETAWPVDRPIVSDVARQRALQIPEWAVALLPIRFSKGDHYALVLGSRAGGRRFLSEDLMALQRIGAVVTARIERFRSEQMSQLVSQAELRALQAQINPHFLFNALNTIYGTIGRGSPDARKLVLNLAEIFRARLQTRRMYVPLSDELELVRAYLEIEAIRLGGRLTTETIIDDHLRSIIVPVLSIQPIVENAVKHGMSPSGFGFVRLMVTDVPGGVLVKVEDRGPGFSNASSGGLGLGLDNVRRRLKLCYGSEVDLRIESTGAGSTVSFSLPRSEDTATSESSWKKLEVSIS